MVRLALIPGTEESEEPGQREPGALPVPLFSGITQNSAAWSGLLIGMTEVYDSE